MNNCLVICPTYNRPVQFMNMVRSFYENNKCSDLIVLTERGSITTLINQVNYDKYKYISVTNDDFLYNTKWWDSILIETLERKGGGIAFGNDGTNNKHLPSTCVMSAAIPRALGWIQYPKLKHLCGDMVWQKIGKSLNRLFYHNNVKIDHMHFLFNKGDKADYEYSNSREMYIKDNATYQHWLLHESKEDIEKVRVALDM